jgi:Ser-tRNA(Ala) deacylase AlaX
MTEELFRVDAALTECAAVVIAIDERGVQLDRTVFYPHGGGPAGDRVKKIEKKSAATRRVVLAFAP